MGVGGMQRLSEIDLPALAPNAPRWVIDVITALICLGLMVVVRIIVQMFAPGAAPFGLLFPFALIATLLSGWRAGALAFYGGGLTAWYYVWPPTGFGLPEPIYALHLIVIAASGALMLGVAQVFRDSAKRAGAERAAKLEERELLLRELNHRVANNFQMVGSLLQLQAKGAQGEARAALESALNRVMSISQAHRNLYVFGEDVARVDMKAYLEDLCHNLAQALLLGEIVVLDCRADPAQMDRDRAVAIGLVVNELVTNAAKHAFADGAPGRIQVVFEGRGEGWRLSVSDNGKGLPKDFARARKGLGRGLVEAFARQAGGELAVEEGPGAAFVLSLRP